MGGDPTGDQVSCQSSRLPCRGGIQREHQHLVCTRILLLSWFQTNFTSMECDENQRCAKDLYLETVLFYFSKLEAHIAQRTDTSSKFKQIHTILHQKDHRLMCVGGGYENNNYNYITYKKRRGYRWVQAVGVIKEHKRLWLQQPT